MGALHGAFLHPSPFGLITWAWSWGMPPEDNQSRTIRWVYSDLSLRSIIPIWDWAKITHTWVILTKGFKFKTRQSLKICINWYQWALQLEDGGDDWDTPESRHMAALPGDSTHFRVFTSRSKRLYSYQEKKRWSDFYSHDAVTSLKLRFHDPVTVPVQIRMIVPIKPNSCKCVHVYVHSHKKWEICRFWQVIPQLFHGELLMFNTYCEGNEMNSVMSGFEMWHFFQAGIEMWQFF